MWGIRNEMGDVVLRYPVLEKSHWTKCQGSWWWSAPESAPRNPWWEGWKETDHLADRGRSGEIQLRLRVLSASRMEP